MTSSGAASGALLVHNNWAGEAEPEPVLAAPSGSLAALADAAAMRAASKRHALPPIQLSGGGHAALAPLLPISRPGQGQAIPEERDE
jgi:hypothetical protein